MKKRVLMIAYACDPQGVGEHWLGWGWVEQAAALYDVDLITTSKAQAAVIDASRRLEVSPHFVDLSPGFRRLTEVARFDWGRKLRWQWLAARKAAQLHAAVPFHLVHQTTFHTFRVPFRASALDIPSVWGPIAGGESVPPGFDSCLGSEAAAERRRHMINRLWLRHPAVRRSLNRSNTLFVSNQTTATFLPEACRGKIRIVPPNALRPADLDAVTGRRTESPRGSIRLLYAGNCVATRAMPLVFEAIAQVRPLRVELTVIGAGPALPDWQRRVEALGLGGQVRFPGRIPHQDLGKHYESSDLFVFPALRDSGGSALLEAMARHLPVMCLDWAGPGEMVTAETGIKLPATTPGDVVSHMAREFHALARDPMRLGVMAAAARQHVLQHFQWSAKRQVLEQTYRELLVP